MFTRKTTFILGAGASWHYGYPTGETLVKKVIEKGEYASRYFQSSAAQENSQPPQFLIDSALPGTSIPDQWRAAHQTCEALAAGLKQVNPLVIDYFLGWNLRLKAIGKLLIAWVILECEDSQARLGGNVNRREALINSPLEADRMKSNAVDLTKYKDDWCRFLIHQLAVNCKASQDLLKNNITFVTFNYDVSLERAIHEALELDFESFD